MRFPGHHFERIARGKADDLLADLDIQLPAEDKEALADALMVVPHLASAWRNTLLDYAQVRTIHQPPAIAFSGDALPPFGATRELAVKPPRTTTRRPLRLQRSPS